MPDKELTEDDLKNMSAEEIAELQKQNCIFCKISEKQIPAKIVHEDSDVMCILDINPASEGHILVYPKKHYMILPHIPDDMLFKIFKDVKLMSHTLLKALQCKGTTIFIANGSAAGQRAPHVLIHVFPRRENDNLVKLPKYEMNDEQIEKLGRSLKPYINQMFGRAHPMIPKNEVKEAEFEEIKEASRHPESEAESSQHVKKHASDIRDDEEKKKILRKDIEKKNSDSKKDIEKKSSGSKVDLDDIAKLFGG